MLTPEELEPTPEQMEEAKQLVAEGWFSTSNKYRSIARFKVRLTGKDLVRPEYHDTEMGKLLIHAWEGSWERHLLRCGSPEIVEHRELTTRMFRAFKLSNGPVA
jgi:hypothetical protein